MQKAVPEGLGTMAAVLGLPDDRVEALCAAATKSALETRAPEAAIETIVQPANFNAPGQVVIAGSTDAVQAAIRLVKESPEFKGGKAMPLAVSAPFHCRLMAPARSKMAEIFAQATAAEKPAELAFPYVPNRTARISREAGLVLEFLVEQVDHPVLWKQSVLYLLEAGFRRAVEFGPGKVLQGLAKRIPAADGAVISAISVGDLNGIKALETLK
jgi:[acyl-carrier-protein] S-malonyltransferase